jgi:hypothetical protein
MAPRLAHPSMETAVASKKSNPCWKNYEMAGMKKGKGGKPVPNCVPKKQPKRKK